MSDKTEEPDRPVDQVRRALDEFLDRLARAVAAKLITPTQQPDVLPVAPPGARSPEDERA